MADEIFLKVVDEIGPETMVYVYDPDTGMKGVLVVDNTAPGTAGGGTRMLPDITAEEIFGLARAMTNKFAILDLPRGGCKAGIWGDPSMPKDKKREVMLAFGRALRPYLESRTVALATDMGVGGNDLAAIYEGVGVPLASKSGLSAQEKDGEPLENHFTGYGVIVAMKRAAQIAGLDLGTATVAIEGFGKVGGGAMRYSVEEGAKVVAVSTMHEAIYNADGLDTAKLLELRRKLGDACLAEYKDAEHMAASDIYYLPVDILLPGARPYVITSDNVDRVQAKILSSGANIPMTHEAEKIFFSKGILSVPDFIANAGGTVSMIVSYLNGNADQAFKAIDILIGRLTEEVLTEAQKQNVDPYTIALDRCREWVLNMRKQTKKMSFQETLQEIKGRLGVF